VSAYYSPEHDRGLLRSDPALGIALSVSAKVALTSERSIAPGFDKPAAVFSIRAITPWKSRCNGRRQIRKRSRMKATTLAETWASRVFIAVNNQLTPAYEIHCLTELTGGALRLRTLHP
jgi:hypothetical protein